MLENFEKAIWLPNLSFQQSENDTRLDRADDMPDHPGPSSVLIDSENSCTRRLERRAQQHRDDSLPRSVL